MEKSIHRLVQKNAPVPEKVPISSKGQGTPQYPGHRQAPLFNPVVSIWHGVRHEGASRHFLTAKPKNINIITSNIPPRYSSKFTPEVSFATRQSDLRSYAVPAAGHAFLLRSSRSSHGRIPGLGQRWHRALPKGLGDHSYLIYSFSRRHLDFVGCLHLSMDKIKFREKILPRSIL